MRVYAISFEKMKNYNYEPFNKYIFKKMGIETSYMGQKNKKKRVHVYTVYEN